MEYITNEELKWFIDYVKTNQPEIFPKIEAMICKGLLPAQIMTVARRFTDDVYIIAIIGIIADYLYHKRERESRLN